jgi:four helix bundle protein
MHEYNFEKLEIWKLSIRLAVSVYRITKKYPEAEKYGLVSQLRRSASSISSNIAEGVSRFGTKDRARFIEIAYGSTIEVLNHFILSKELEFIDDVELESYRTTISELSNKINAFHKNLR